MRITEAQYLAAIERRDDPEHYTEVEDFSIIRRWEWVQGLHEMADLFLDDELQTPYGMRPYCNVTHYHSEQNEDGHYPIDVERTTLELAKIVNAVKPCTKKYTDDDFQITKDFQGEHQVQFYASRESVCKRKVVGKKVVPAVPEKVIDEIEWECEKVSFLAADTN